MRAARRSQHMQIPDIHSTYDSVLSAALDAAINNKTKPLGSLGMLESIARQIGLIQKTTKPQLIAPAIIVFAADHGIVAENVSAYPQSVTWQMVENFLAQGAAINVFARQNNCALLIVDAGVNHDFGPRAGLIDRKVGPGTCNFAQQPAMTKAQCELAMQHGADLVASLEGNVVGFGDMGIGNTTAAAAIMHKLTGIPVAKCVGAGAGLAAVGILHKQKVIRDAVGRHGRVTEPLDILTTFGGFEIAMIAGAMLAAAERRMVVLIDGFIVTSALLVAASCSRQYSTTVCFRIVRMSTAHVQMLEYLGAKPLLQLGLRLGEGTGCALALPLVHAAVNFMRDMATFESASVSEKLE
jgi:nicotinate-nucleotide--dimethylbenzimidazole phosphoribosyltransferase